MSDVLTEDNFILYAAKHYNNLQCFSTEEFYNDLKRLKYIKRIINKYKKTGELKERLLLNHVIVLNNVFGPTVCTRLLYLFNSKDMSIVKPFLVLTGIMPEQIVNVFEYKAVYSTDIIMDQYVVQRLREI